MVEHTPTPWDCFVDDEGTSVGAHSGGHRICIVRVSGSITNPHIQADINFLLGAVNNQVEMVEALKQSRAALDAIKFAVEASGKLNDRGYISLGIQVNNALDKAGAMLSRVGTSHE